MRRTTPALLLALAAALAVSGAHAAPPEHRSGST